MYMWNVLCGQEVSEKLQQFWGVWHGVERSQSNVCLTLVWRQNGDSPTALMPTLSVSPLAASQVRPFNDKVIILLKLNYDFFLLGKQCSRSCNKQVKKVSFIFALSPLTSLKKINDLLGPELLIWRLGLS